GGSRQRSTVSIGPPARLGKSPRRSLKNQSKDAGPRLSHPSPGRNARNARGCLGPSLGRRSGSSGSDLWVLFCPLTGRISCQKKQTTARCPLYRASRATAPFAGGATRIAVH